MALSVADVRRWQEGFAAAEEADRAERRRAGPRPEWSIASALSLIAAARAAGGPPPDPRRADRERAARAAWERVRSRRAG